MILRMEGVKDFFYLFDCAEQCIRSECLQKCTAVCVSAIATAFVVNTSHFLQKRFVANGFYFTEIHVRMEIL